MNIILNVKEDHLDFFKDIDDIRHSFKLFTEKLPSDGTLIINTDIDNYEYFYQDTDCEVITFGSDPAKSMYSASDITYDELGRCTYSLLINGEKADTITLGVPGLHNVYNSLAAIAAARKLLLIWSISRQVFLTLRVLTEDLRRRVHLTVLLSLMIMHITLMKSVLL